MPLENVNALLGAAVLGVLGAAGMYIVERYRQQKNQVAMAKDLARLDHELGQVKRELEYLLKQKHERSAKTKKNKHVPKANSVISNSTIDDYLSVTNLDSSDLEYYDVSDHESDTIEDTYPHLENVLHDVDFTLDSDSLPQLQNVLGRLTELLIEHTNNPEILWRIGKAHHKISEKIEDRDAIKDHLSKGIEVCSRALEINPDHAEIHKWFAILIGSRSEIVSTKEKINDGHLFKKHVDAAIAINPNDSSLHHMLGRFAYEVAALKWYERKVAATLFAEPPHATYEDALKHFLEAEKLTSFQWKENKLMIAKCKIALKEYKQAVEWLKKAKNCAQEGGLDDKIDSETNVLLNTYSSFL